MDTAFDFHPLTIDEMSDLGMATSEFLEQMEDALGPEAVWALTRQFGGTHVLIPQKRKIASSPLTRALGQEIVEWLCDMSHGEILIPLGAFAASAVAVAKTRSLVLDGKSISQIAAHLKCNPRTVCRQKAKLKDAGFL